MALPAVVQGAPLPLAASVLPPSTQGLVHLPFIQSQSRPSVAIAQLSASEEAQMTLRPRFSAAEKGKATETRDTDQETDMEVDIIQGAVPEDMNSKLCYVK